MLPTIKVTAPHIKPRATQTKAGAGRDDRRAAASSSSYTTGARNVGRWLADPIDDGQPDDGLRAES